MFQLTSEQKKKIEELISIMTLEEKIGQMNQEIPSIVGGFNVSFEELNEMANDGRISMDEFKRILSTSERDYHEEDIRQGLIGSMIIQNAHKANELQKIALEESRLGIPLLIGFDVIHGLRTVYPIALAEAGTFDVKLFEKTARMAAKESRAHGVNWNFAPMIDIARDQRWGRISEGPGEDPYLACVFAEAKIQGLQGDTSSSENYVAACLKHYVAYGACEAGRDYNTTSMSISQLHNVYLKPFKAAVDKGAATVMASFNDLNGVPCTVNSYTLRTILKEQYQFEGFVVSDANGIKECIDHGIAEDAYDAGCQALLAGLDMDMGTHIYKEQLKRGLEEEKVTQKYIDDAVRRILSVKMWLGLFDNPYVAEENIKKNEIICEENIALALETAKKSIVLLKNEGNILPLEKHAKISLVGTLANQKNEVAGAWAMGYKADDCVTILEGLKNSGADVSYFPCGGPEDEWNKDEVKQACVQGDVIIAVVGETASMTGEASSKADLELPGTQREMLKALVESGKTVIVLLMNGRPLALSWEAEHLPVLVETWHLGIQMGNAVASVIFGEQNPEGKLSASFPAVTGQCPIYYSHPNTGRPGSKSKFTSRYIDAPFEPLYPFGFGLSYTEFQYGELEILDSIDDITVRVVVQNKGACAGTETVQVYVRDVVGSLVRPIKELKGFKKVHLQPEKKEIVEISISKSELGYYNNNGDYILEDGKFIIFAGGNSRDCLFEEIIIKF